LTVNFISRDFTMSNAIPPGHDHLIPHLVCDPCAEAVVMLADDFPEFCGGKSQSPKALKGTPVTIHRYVENCDAAIKRAQDAGATVLLAAQDMFWGDRYGIVIDPFGHKWSIGTHQKDLTPAEMQAGLKDCAAKASARA
jgi:PhnB protein